MWIGCVTKESGRTADTSRRCVKKGGWPSSIGEDRHGDAVGERKKSEGCHAQEHLHSRMRGSWTSLLPLRGFWSIIYDVNYI